MSLTVITDEPGSVNAEYNVQILKRNIMYEHIIRPLEKARVYCDNRRERLLCHAGRHCYRVLFRYADIKKTFREALRKLGKPRSGAHGGGYCNDIVIYFGKLRKLFSENR